MNLTKIESAVANTILDFCFRNDVKVSHLKLQKLYYFSAGYALADKQTYIASHEFQAWMYGPVLPGLYSELEHYGDSNIVDYLSFEGNMYIYLNGEIFESISDTLKKNCNKTAWELSEISHAKNGPWFKTVAEKGYKGEIPKEQIMEYFQKIS